jgi:hypothetical protein
LGVLLTAAAVVIALVAEWPVLAFALIFVVGFPSVIVAPVWLEGIAARRRHEQFPTRRDFTTPDENTGTSSAYTASRWAGARSLRKKVFVVGWKRTYWALGLTVVVAWGLGAWLKSVLLLQTMAIAWAAITLLIPIHALVIGNRDARKISRIPVAAAEDLAEE